MGNDLPGHLEQPTRTSAPWLSRCPPEQTKKLKPIGWPSTLWISSLTFRLGLWAIDGLPGQLLLCPTAPSPVSIGRRGQRSSTSLPVTPRGHLCKQGFRGFKGEKGEPGQPGLDGLDAPCQLVQYSSLFCLSSPCACYQPTTTTTPSLPPPPYVPAEGLTPRMAQWHVFLPKWIKKLMQFSVVASRTSPPSTSHLLTASSLFFYNTQHYRRNKQNQHLRVWTVMWPSNRSFPLPGLDWNRKCNSLPAVYSMELATILTFNANNSFDKTCGSHPPPQTPQLPTSSPLYYVITPPSFSNLPSSICTNWARLCRQTKQWRQTGNWKLLKRLGLSPTFCFVSVFSNVTLCFVLHASMHYMQKARLKSVFCVHRWMIQLCHQLSVQCAENIYHKSPSLSYFVVIHR